MSVFWIDRFADKLDSAICLVYSSPSPNNVETVFDAAKAFLIYKKVKMKKKYSKFIFLHNDNDVLKKIPNTLPDLDGIVKAPKPLKKYIGVPYNRVPSPFSSSSWAQHFSRMSENCMSAMGMYSEFFNVSELYRLGKFNKYILQIFEKIKKSRSISKKFLKTGKNHMPFDALCKSCNRYSKIKSFSLEHMNVDYKCPCGYEGVSDFRNGKLHRSFEIAALWCIFEITFQPSEHSEKASIEICKNIFEKKPPMIKTHKPLTIDGKAPSNKNVHITSEILRVIEPEALLYFYSKSGYTSRNINFKNIHNIVDEFDRAERVYFGLEKQRNKRVISLMKKSYEISMEKIPKKIPIRIPFEEAVTIANISTHKRMEIAMDVMKSLGILKYKLPNMDTIKRRLTLADYWSQHYSKPLTVNRKANNEMLNEKQKIAIREFSKELDSKTNISDVLNRLANEIGISEKSLYSGIYQILISKRSGPHLSSLIHSIGAKEVSRLLGSV